MLLVRWLTTTGRSWRLAATYLVCASAGLYTHYVFPATLLTQNLIVLGWLSWQSWVRRISAFSASRIGLRLVIVRWIGLMAATLLLYLPWVPIYLRQAGDRAAVHPSPFDFLQDSGYFMLFGPTVEARDVYWPLLAALLLLILGIINGPKRAAVAIVSLFLPWLIIFAVGATRPEFFKFLLVSIPFLAILQGLSWQGQYVVSKWVRWLLPLPLLALLWGNLHAIGNLYNDPAYARDDYRGMAARIADEAHPNAGIILSAPNQWEVFTYYHQEGAPVYPIPRGQPNPDQIEAELQTITRRHERLYALFWGERQQDPEGLVERWLNTHTFKAVDEWVGNVRFVTYAVPAVTTVEMATAAGWYFGDQIILNGYTIANDHLTAGDILQITLFWQATGPIERRYKTFLHLVDDQGQLIAQQDSEPAGGSRPTTAWHPEEAIVDRHGILVPDGGNPGSYTLMLGLYDLIDPTARLPITASTLTIDAIPLAVVTIE
jgi:mannosyltransferase